MKITKTFDEIFDQLHHLYKGKWIQIQVKKDGLILSNFSVQVKDLQIRPLEDKGLCRRLGLKRKEKLGSIVIKGSHTENGQVVDCLNIPFKLGFDTMDAHFLRKNVSIETCGFEFILRKLSPKEIRTLSA
ncbi:hypothetical protein BBF96_15330 [Anoxybacter fermentans]|uniref:Uncharacterized protein n=1 Tax=Anoxybacter fermentans TaxID=1323375 RepID=A0A3S9T254_9FIRM|nr:hypothetical protein [Anoxybacter fermentans]AZR74625.1 hypothetical protein BBF96_15330 [Anoxybacter fermentans]